MDKNIKKKNREESVMNKEGSIKKIKIIITAQYELDLSADDMNEIEKIVTETWPNARSLHTESNTCESFETEMVPACEAQNMTCRDTMIAYAIAHPTEEPCQ
jgi:hypothetical protein